MPTTLTIQISHPDVVTGDARIGLYNSIAHTLDELGPEWTHRLSHSDRGKLVMYFVRGSAVKPVPSDTAATGGR